MRRGFLGNLLGFAWPSAAAAGSPKGKILIKSAWGSADPTQASFAFHHANAFAEAGHEVQIFLLGEAVTLMRAAVAGSVVPVGWPPLAEALAKVLDHKIPIHV
jgi:predicted peroxiredoxin